MTSDLGDLIQNVRFTPVRLHNGYDMGEVDYLLDRLEAAVGEPDTITEILDHAAFSEVRLREGYDIAEVDAFLSDVRAAATMPTPTSAPAPAPAPVVPPLPQVIVEQRGFFARLFGRR